MTPPSLPETTASLQCVHLRLAQLPVSVPFKAQLQAGALQLRWLRNLEMWVKTVSAAVIFDPLLQGGGGSRRLQVWASDTRASRQMVAPTNYKQCTERCGSLGP